MKTIDLNADVGEGFATDAELIPLVTSANIACGGHAGDEVTMEAAARVAIESGVAIGAHPGHEDRKHFGRRELPISPDGLVESLTRQVNRLHAIVAGLGGSVGYLKPHGALYHQASRDAAVAGGVIRFLESYHTPLALLGLPDSALQEAARDANIPFYAEAFADRAYLADGSLAPRSTPGAVLSDEAAITNQALRLARDGRATTLDCGEIPVPCDSLCLHGDDPTAIAAAAAVRSALCEAKVSVLRFSP